MGYSETSSVYKLDTRRQPQEAANSPSNNTLIETVLPYAGFFLRVPYHEERQSQPCCNKCKRRNAVLPLACVTQVVHVRSVQVPVHIVVFVVFAVRRSVSRCCLVQPSPWNESP